MTAQSPLMLSAGLLLTTLAVVPAQQPNRSAPPPLPEGPAKALVESTCSKCHGLNFIVNSGGNTRAEWDELIQSMVALPGADRTATVDYLAKHFPPTKRTEAKLLPGPAKVSIREWMVPTLGSRPHDPLAGADGSIWWTGQYASRLGRLDIKTGDLKEFPLKTADSGPHGLVEDRAGNVWFTAISKNYIGRLDPKTGQVTEYPLNEPGSRGPHTPIFDQKGTLFFTLQSGHVGRLVPSTGVMTIVKTPTDNTYPYGIQVNSKGVPWYVDFRGNRVGSVDPETMKITEYPLPDPAARARRISDGSIPGPARSRNGPRRAVSHRSPTASPPTRTSSGTASRR
jgi:virginiamycin B lyase